MECKICDEEFNHVERVPKNVPCGHMVCLQCLQDTKKKCPACSMMFEAEPAALITNLTVLENLRQKGDTSVRRGWCSECRAIAARRCWYEHEVLAVKAALRRYLDPAGLQQAGEQLVGLQRQVQEAETLLTLLSADFWNLSLCGSEHQLTATVRNSEDPLTKVMWLVMAEKFSLQKVRHAEMEPPGPSPAAEDLKPIVLNTPPPMNERPEFLRKVTGMTYFCLWGCERDPAWYLEVLQCVAPTAERLTVSDINNDHLHTIFGMPRLKRLRFSYKAADPSSPPPVLPAALPPGHSGLRRLGVSKLPLFTLKSLLQAHAHTLQVLTVPVADCDYPNSCNELKSVLAQCNLSALMLLYLDRRCLVRQRQDCQSQRNSFRAKLHETEVLCTHCCLVTN